MNIFIEVNDFMLNTTIYLYQGGKCVIIDPSDPNSTENTINNKNWIPLAVLFTHSHFDHIAGIKPLIKKNPLLPIYINPTEKGNLFSPQGNLSELVGVPFSIPQDSNIIEVQNNKGFIVESEDLSFSLLFQAYYVPGHSRGSTMYEFKAQNENDEEITWLSTGDFLFEGTVGRTDFVGGSSKDMKESIEKFKQRYFPRKDENILIIPGHASSKNSPVISLENELKRNQFLKNCK